MVRYALFASAAVLAFAAGGVRNADAALSVTLTDSAATLTNALLAPASGITLVSSSLSGGTSQQGTYTGYSLAPSSGTGPTFTLGDGVVLSSGLADVPLTNTVNDFGDNTGTQESGNALLDALSGRVTFNASVLTYVFTLAPGLNAVSATFQFGTDEFPTQNVVDIFGFFVDGVNFAKFPNGQLIQNTPENPANFTSNPVGGGLYNIEWNGLTSVFTVTGVVDPTKTQHELVIGIADTNDTVFNSAVYITGLTGAFTTGGGGIGNGTPVPEPATLGLLGLGLLGLGAARRLGRKRA